MSRANSNIKSLELILALGIVGGLSMIGRSVSQKPVSHSTNITERVSYLGQDSHYSSNSAVSLDPQALANERNRATVYYQSIIDAYASNPNRFERENNCEINPEPLRAVAQAYHAMSALLKGQGKSDEARSCEESAKRMMEKVARIYKANTSTQDPNASTLPGLLPFPNRR